MSTTIRYCLGGRWNSTCNQWGQHTDDCPERPATEDEPAVECRGCAPKLATNGYLCEGCHRRLAQHLNPGRIDGDRLMVSEGSLLWVHHWLGMVMSGTRSTPARQDWERSGSRELSVPLVLGIYDCRKDLAEEVYVMEERCRQTFGENIVDQLPFDLIEGVAYLARRLMRIEDDPDLCGWIYHKIAGRMVESHLRAPWRRAVEKVRGIPCPHCDRVALARFGGEDMLTCRNCGDVVASERSDQWTAMVHYERGLSA